MDGNILILDHEDIDIILMLEKSKCVTFPKKEMSDKVYNAQDRMFKRMFKDGIISPSSVRGGNVYGSMKAEIHERFQASMQTRQSFSVLVNSSKMNGRSSRQRQSMTRLDSTHYYSHRLKSLQILAMWNRRHLRARWIQPLDLMALCTTTR